MFRSLAPDTRDLNLKSMMNINFIQGVLHDEEDLSWKNGMGGCQMERRGYIPFIPKRWKQLWSHCCQGKPKTICFHYVR